LSLESLNFATSSKTGTKEFQIRNVQKILGWVNSISCGSMKLKDQS